MIATVRQALRSLGGATEEEIRAETGLDRWQVECALELLIRRGDAVRVAPQDAPAPAGLARGAKDTPRAICRACPMVTRCTPIRSSCPSPGPRPTLIVPAG